MLVPIEMLINSNEFISPLNRFLSDKVEHRRSLIESNLNQILKVVFDLLKDVELLEPRFSCSPLQDESNSYQKINYKGKLKVINCSHWILKTIFFQMNRSECYFINRIRTNIILESNGCF